MPNQAPSRTVKVRFFRLKSCSHGASTLKLLDWSRTHLIFNTLTLTFGVNVEIETYVFLRSVDSSVNVRVNADARCEHTPTHHLEYKFSVVISFNN